MLDPVTGAFECDDVGVMHDTVDHRRSDGGLAEDLAPAGERQVGGQDDRGLLVPGGDQLEEQIGRFGVEGDIADFVDLSRYRNRSTYADPVTMPPALRVSERSCWLTSYRLVSRL